MIVFLFLLTIKQLLFISDFLATDGEFIYLSENKQVFISKSDTFSPTELNLPLPTDFQIRYLDGDRFYIYVGDREKIFRIKRSDLSIKSYKRGRGIIDLACDDEGRVMTIEDWGRKVLIDGELVMPGIDYGRHCGVSNGKFYIADRGRIIFLSNLITPDSIIDLPKENLNVAITKDKFYAYDERSLYRYDEGRWRCDRLPVRVKYIAIIGNHLYMLDADSHLYLISD